jgi:hypothetical protein
MSFGKVAGFLRRTEDEVREKAKELNYRERATLRSSIGGRRNAPNALPKSQTIFSRLKAAQRSWGMLLRLPNSM